MGRHCKSRIIVTRWERDHGSDDNTHLEITTQQPPVGQGWTRCVVDVSGPQFVYLTKEAW